MSAEPSKGNGIGFELASTGTGITKFEIGTYSQNVGTELVGSISSGNYYFLNSTIWSCRVSHFSEIYPQEVGQAKGGRRVI